MSHAKLGNNNAGIIIIEGYMTEHLCVSLVVEILWRFLALGVFLVIIVFAGCRQKSERQKVQAKIRWQSLLQHEWRYIWYRTWIVKNIRKDRRKIQRKGSLFLLEIFLLRLKRTEHWEIINLVVILCQVFRVIEWYLFLDFPILVLLDRFYTDFSQLINCVSQRVKYIFFLVGSEEVILGVFVGVILVF